MSAWADDLRAFVEETLEVRDLSAHGLVVAQLLDEAFGLDRFRRHISAEVHWSDPDLIVVLFRGALATFDPDGLTQLVVRCHDACVRLEIGPGGVKTIRLTFSRRQRAGDLHARHPEMGAALERVRRFDAYGKVL